MVSELGVFYNIMRFYIWHKLIHYIFCITIKIVIYQLKTLGCKSRAPPHVSISV